MTLDEAWGYAIKALSRPPAKQVNCDLLRARLRDKIPCCKLCHERDQLQEIILEDGRRGFACCNVISRLMNEDEGPLLVKVVHEIAGL
jgi:hypothetical protein